MYVVLLCGNNCDAYGPTLEERGRKSAAYVHAQIDRWSFRPRAGIWQLCFE